MAQAGFVSCSGCGQLFKRSSPKEMRWLEEHTCDQDWLDQENKHYERQVYHAYLDGDI